MYKTDVIYEINKVPSSENWDKLTESYFQKTDFLRHAEKYNKCHQRYYLLYNQDELKACAVMYSLRLDIFTYLKIKSPLKMNIVGIPSSVSASGIFGEEKYIKHLIKYIYSNEKGFILTLNLKSKLETNIASGKTLPTIIFKKEFSEYREYTKAIRHGYRRRLNKINKHIEGLKLTKHECNVFTEEMYKQYLNVYKKSNAKLEILSLEFFKNLPKNFILTTCSYKKLLIGWSIATEDNDKYYFFLGGIDYKYNSKYNTYLRLLSDIVQSGIKYKAKTIDMGQTAETPKLRMGGKVETLYMEAFHSNKILNSLLKRFSKLLEYKTQLETPKVFKEESL